MAEGDSIGDARSAVPRDRNRLVQTLRETPLPPRERRRGVLPGVALAAVGGLAAMGCAQLARGRPTAFDGTVRAKYEYVAQRRGEYDLLFFGSSRTNMGVQPASVEREMAARGQPVRCFNMALLGMGQLETDQLIRDVVALQPARFRWFVIELSPQLSDRPQDSKRWVSWHSPRQLWSWLETEWISGGGWQLAPAHLRAAGLNAMSVGFGRSIVERRFGREPEFAAAWTKCTDGAGFVPASNERHRRDFVRSWDEIAANFATRGGATGELLMPPARQPAWRRQIRFLERHGVEPIYFVPPGARATRVGAPSEGGARLVNMNEPERYPELFTLESLHDLNHLTPDGARLHSELLAARLVELLEE